MNELGARIPTTRRELLLDLAGAAGFVLLIYIAANLSSFTRATLAPLIALTADLLCLPILVRINPLRGGLTRILISSVLAIGMLAVTAFGIAVLLGRFLGYAWFE
jgi:hypothetical protein